MWWIRADLPGRADSKVAKHLLIGAAAPPRRRGREEASRQFSANWDAAGSEFFLRPEIPFADAQHTNAFVKVCPLDP